MTAPPEGKRRSVSQLTGYARCGEAYRLERVAKVPRAPAAWLAQGIAVHSALEAWERARCGSDGVLLPAGRAIDEYHTEYDRLIAEDIAREPSLGQWLTGGRVKPHDDISRRRDRGADQIARYIEYARLAPERPLDMGGGDAAVEVPFDMQFGGIRVVGYIDQVIEWPDGALTPRDLKSGSKRPEWQFQLVVYGHAIAEVFGVPVPEHGDFYMLKDNQPDRMVPLYGFDRALVADWFQRLESGINAGAFVPNPGDACRTCGVREWCAAVGGLRASEAQPEGGQ